MKQPSCAYLKRLEAGSTQDSPTARLASLPGLGSPAVPT
jgi:hypothetical protein